MTEPQHWKVIAEKKQAAVKAKIPAQWIMDTVPDAIQIPNAADYLDKVLPAEVVNITSKTIRDLADSISKGQLTSVQVVTAFCHRAAFAHQMLNCCTEIFFDEALRRAEELDDYYKKHKKVVGPLHGIPISLKDQVNIEGLETSIGYVGLLGKPATRDQESTIAVLLRTAGAVFYVKTTTPMAMMSADTFSNAFGYTQNAINRKVSPGGSSGGEGALVGARGSLLGLGTDIGGSIRIPSSFNGLYGLRPSHGRFSYQKVTNSNSGQSVIPSVIGPMAQDLDDLEYFCKAWFATEPWHYDSEVVPLPWREVTVRQGEKLSFGVMKWDGLIHPHPPVNRAIEETIQALKEAGHEVIDWEPQNHREILDCAMRIYWTDGNKEVIDACKISGEPPLVGLESEPWTINQHWADADKKRAIQERYLKYWNETANRTFNGKPICAWIFPVWESASFFPGSWDDTMTTSYTVAINVLDWPVVLTPVTHVSKAVDIPDEKFDPASEYDEINHKNYDPELFDGTPVGIQVITRRFEEEKAVAYSRVLRDALSKR
jgi:amidase